MGSVLSNASNKAIEARFSPSEVLKTEPYTANLKRNTADDGGCHIKGNGAFVLTHDQLWFKFIGGCCCCDKEIDIPLLAITDLKARPSRFHVLLDQRRLYVRYIDPETKREIEIEFAVERPLDWIEEINQQKQVLRNMMK